jgi:WD40 repeat protein
MQSTYQNHTYIHTHAQNRLQHTLQNPFVGSIRSMCASRDGRLMVSGDRDGRIIIWNPHDGGMLSHVDAHALHVRAVSLSVDSLWLASGSEDKSVKLWTLGRPGGRGQQANPHELMLHTTLDGDHTAGVYGVAISPDSSKVASASADSKVIFWPMPGATGQKRVLTGHVGPVLCISWAPDSRHLASGGSDASIRVWNIETEVLFVCVFCA